jgi:23S rRNA (adenine2030-N6)-methyltransferase
MLSYQHGYHAGSRADIHKHDILARALETLCADAAPVLYFDTHAGRGLYSLVSKQAEKTGEAGEGWLKLIEQESNLKNLSLSYVATVRSLNDGKLSSRYPGSPAIAAHMLRPQDKIKLLELHPTEYASLRQNFGHDKRISIVKQDGYEGALQTISKGKSLVLVDPSYEVKTEYDAAADFVVDLNKKAPDAVVLVWAPMLVAKRHEVLLDKLVKNFKDLKLSEVRWAEPGAVRGMYGSIMMGINAADAFKNSAASFISKL